MKADIRGSVDITYTMIERGLNPASYFSLNFFDPISEILFDYGGAKEFIEGDAIIMSLFEHEDTPEGWYSVARACGLAVRLLQHVQQYNVTSQKHKLPVLELGIGICFHQSPPSFLFDGDSRIIISPAINLADRLSSCSRRSQAAQGRQRLFKPVSSGHP
jgi:class 3 adenylate cyclase